MIVVCKVELCPYRSKNNFCRKKIIGITENGMCNHIYDKHGQIKATWQNPVDENLIERFNIQENGDKNGKV